MKPLLPSADKMTDDMSSESFLVFCRPTHLLCNFLLMFMVNALGCNNFI